MDDFYCDGAASKWLELRESIEKGLIMDKPVLKQQSIYDQKTLEALLLRVCDEVENGGIYEMTDYLMEFWNPRRDAFYENRAKAERRAQYLKLKEEFGQEELSYQVP